MLLGRCNARGRARIRHYWNSHDKKIVSESLAVSSKNLGRSSIHELQLGLFNNHFQLLPSEAGNLVCGNGEPERAPALRHDLAAEHHLERRRNRQYADRFRRAVEIESLKEGGEGIHEVRQRPGGSPSGLVSRRRSTSRPGSPTSRIPIGMERKLIQSPKAPAYHSWSQPRSKDATKQFAKISTEG